MTAPRLLLVERDPTAWGALPHLLDARGYRVLHATGPDLAERELAGGPVDLVLADLETAGDSALAWTASPGEPALVLLDDFGSAAEDLAALERGAAAVLHRPLPDEQVVHAVERALEARKLAIENTRLKQDLERRHALGGLISRDPRMKRLFQLVEAVADTRASLLVEGESGTGKTALARAVHGLSGRASGPFVELNCGAIPGDLLESELFGHARGAFTGAVRDRIGKFEAADGGTLFLDEIASASPEMQVVLLRVLESGCFERVGETQTRRADVRLIAASNRPLEQEIAAGRFREDLYFRIQVVTLELPPLRERVPDIPLLAERFLERAAREHGRGPTRFSPAALGLLLAHDWPGNVRELEHAVERAVLLAGGTAVETCDLPPGLLRRSAEGAPGTAQPGSAPAAFDLPLGPLKLALAGPERALILKALEATGGSRKETAQLLDINRSTLFNKMRRYGLLSFPTSPADGQGAPLTEADRPERGPGSPPEPLP